MAKFECNSHMENFLKELPKCEHHVHLEGTLEPDLLFSLAKRNSISLPPTFPKSISELNDRYAQFSDLQDFLDHYYIGMSVLIKEDDFYDLAMAYFQKAHNDGLWHAEVFFDPQGHVERGIDIHTVIKGFERACRQAEAQFGITTKLIMCLLRHLSPEDGLKTIEDAKHYYESGVIHGLGLDSSEKPFPPELFVDCYKSVKDSHPKANLTAHAGEEAGPEFITKSLDLLKVTRIDHGVQSYRDPALLKRLSDEKVMLTLCPMSNVKLQVVSDVSELPIKEWLAHNVPFSINSDDPAYFGGYILDNYKIVHTRFGFSLETWCQIARNSIDGSWCDAERKAKLHSNVEEVYNKYKNLIN